MSYIIYKVLGRHRLIGSYGILSIWTQFKDIMILSWTQFKHKKVA